MLRRWRHARGLVLACCALLAATPASAVFTQRYQSIVNGAIVFTGNTLGLDRSGSTYTPGTNGSVGAFLNSDNPAQFGSFGAYTIGQSGASTTLWQNNKSEAMLTLPGGGDVLYAELIWGAAYNVGGANVSSSISNSVTFSTPAGTYTIAPSASPLTSNNRFVASANVTGLVQLAGQGRYAVKGVPASYGNDANSHAAGWTLAVVYRNTSLPTRNISIFVGAEAQGAAPAAVAGFCTPVSGLLKARALVTAIEGDARRGGDFFLFGPTSALGTEHRLSGPNNPLNNFFASQINNSNGALDTSGTRGERNHPAFDRTTDSQVGLVAGARMGWDITNVDASANLRYNQTSAFAQGTVGSGGDQYTIAGLGLQIDLSAPRFNTTNAVAANKTTTYVGDEITYTVTLQNTGGAPADNVVVRSPIPAGMSFVAGSATVDGAAAPSGTLPGGITVGTVAAGASRIVTYRLRVETLPASPAAAQYEHQAIWTYDYIPCAGRSREASEAGSTAVVTPAVRLEGRKTVDPQGSVPNGAVLTYTVTISNTGSVPSSGTTLLDALAAGTEYVGNSTRMNGVVVADDAGGVFPFSTARLVKSSAAADGVIAPGASAVIQFQARVVSPALQIINTATYDADGPSGPTPGRQVTAVNSSFAPARAAKAFAPATVSAGQVSRLTITLSNDNPQALTAVTMTDVMPSELTVAAAPVLANTCGGTVSATPGGIEVSLAGGTIPANGSCTLALNVMTSDSGSFQNTIPAGAVQSAEANPSNTAAQATLTVRQAPLVSKAFSPSTVLRQQTSRLTVTIVNPNSVALTQVALTDNLPSGLVVAATPSTSTSCGGSLTATAGAGSMSFSGGSIAASGVCTLSVNVVASVPGVYRNIIPAGGMTSAEGVSTSPAQADLNVAAIQVEKTFATNPVATNVNSLLTITLINPATTAITGVAFTDTFPAGLITSSLASTNCGGTASTASGSVSLSGGTIPATGSCTVTVNASSGTAGDYLNIIAAGAVTSTNAGSNTVAAEAALSVSQPSVTKAFAPQVLLTGETSTLTITLRNPNTAANANITGVGLTDLLPAGLTAATPATTCGGTATVGVQPGGRHFVRLVGGTIPRNSSGTGTCTVTATITGASAGVYTNIIEAGTVTTTGSGSNNAAAQANLVVLTKPVVTKAFDVASISPGTTARLTVTVENPNALDMTGVTVTDVFPTSPGAMRVAATPDAANACGGSLVDSAGGTLEANDVGIRLTGAVVPAFGTCTFAVNVTASTVGNYSNQIPVGNVAGTVEDVALNGAAAATAPLEVRVLAPLVEKSFTASITTTESAELVLRISNPNPNTALTGVGLRDVFPTVPGNMVVATSLTRTLTGCGGTATGNSGTVGLLQNAAGATLAAGANGIRLTNATVAAGGVCEVRIRVSVSAAGSYLNTTEAVTSGNGGNGQTASAGLTVYAPPVLSKQFTPAEVAVNVPSRLTLSLFNSNTGFPINGIVFSDVFPAGLVLAPVPAPELNCTAGSSLTVTPRAGTPGGYDFSAGSLAGSGVCTFSVNVRAGAIGDYVNTTTTVTTSNAGTGAAATATLTVKGYTLAGTVYDDRNANSVLDAADQPLSPALYVKLAPRVGGLCQAPATQVVQTDAAGKYEMPGVPDGEYCLLVDDSATATDLVVTVPAGYAHTEAPGGLRVVTVAAVGQGQLNFGLFRGMRIDGMVFEDNGAASGTAHDGIRNGGEGGLSGVRVSAHHASCAGGLCAEALTDSDGRFQFLLPAAATLSGLRLVETNASGWISVSGQPGSTGGSYDRAQDTLTFNAVPGGSYTGVTFGDVAPPSWVADGQLNIRPNGVVFYPHVFTAKTAGTLRFETVATPAPAFAGWAQLLFVDSNCNGVLDASETAYAAGATIPVTAGQQVCVLLRQTVASNATIGIRNSVVVTAVFGYSSLPPAAASRHDNTDLTTVSLLSSGLVLIKQVDKATALPGEELNYTITYRNGADQALDNIEIRDVTPAYTTFVSGGCNTPLPQSITACSLSAFPAPGQTGDLMWVLTGQLQPGQEGSVRFRVRINQ